ncbi:MAG: helix-turn-helix transcriptional regulator [Flavobacteriaceae bacterium]|nr:helix-turn-helix transcriptional regulator [Flavobacteriaceae bacterium]
MINSQEFATRLQEVIDFHGESASSFAEKIGVQRSSISHILSGRNKPSLDFVMKVLKHFPSVELYWLLNGKGTFPKSIENTSKEITKSPKSISMDKINHDSNIERIIIFYKDGSFKSYKNE